MTKMVPDIMINDIFRFSEKDLEQEQYKLNLDSQDDEGGDIPLDVYVEDRDKWLNDWLKHRDKGEADRFKDSAFIFALIKYHPDVDSWLFVGIFKKVSPGTEDQYDLVCVDEFKKYEGRLFVSFKRPGRRRTLKLENHLGRLEVQEILREPYSGEAFPGIENINHDFSYMKKIFETQRESWKSALSSIKGVYLITDKSDGKKYVGSAYREGGCIWERWKEYIKTGGHGGNEGLKKLIKEKGEEHAPNNFKFSLLEAMTVDKSDRFILKRESYWKRVLLTGEKEFGYNEN